ncbi:MAG: hypothetical protein AB7T63_10795 [Planctomycetota bacterium]
MGTFHHDKGDLHGITVVVDTPGPLVYVGRCDTITPEGVILLDADVHDASLPGSAGAPVSKEAYLKRAAAWGVFKRHDRVVVPHADVASVRRLGELAS